MLLVHNAWCAVMFCFCFIWRESVLFLDGLFASRIFEFRVYFSLVDDDGHGCRVLRSYRII